MNGKQMVTTEQSNGLPAEYENGGSLAVSLARAEVDLQITTARAYPRSITKAVDHILTLATLDEKTAKMCIYALPRGKDDDGKVKITKGPSIRLAEISASQWGNCRVGARVVHVDRFEKYIEAEGVFHDLETNTAWTSRVRRNIADKKGRVFSADMIVVTGNAACAIAKRNAIFAGIPRGVWGKGYDAAEHIVAGDIKTLAARRQDAIATFFAKYNITSEQIFKALDVDGEDDIDLERLSILTAMRASLKNGEATLDELFPRTKQNGDAPKSLAEKLDSIAAGGNGDPPHDQETGEILPGAPAITPGALDEERKDAGVVTPPETAPASDPILDALLAEAREKAKGGPAAFRKWEARLSAPEFARIEPHLAAVLAEAAGGSK